jgi:hypothetical protein
MQAIITSTSVATAPTTVNYAHVRKNEGVYEPANLVGDTVRLVTVSNLRGEKSTIFIGNRVIETANDDIFERQRFIIKNEQISVNFAS